MLISYLKRHYKLIIMVALFVAVFAAVFSLYELPVEAVLYASALCAVIGAVLFLTGFGLYVKRHRELTAISKRVTQSLSGLPTPKGILEKDYQQMLYTLREETARVESEANTQRRDTEEYYTMWAHQIKTPISAMSLLLQSDGGEYNAQLRAELLRIEQYVDMVLSYVRLGSESNDLVLRPVALDDIIKRAVRKYARLFVIKKLTLTCEESGISVISDDKWLQFIIEQLLSNAIKYTSNGGITIRTRGSCLMVEDTGIGIRAEDLPRIFEKGFTGYNGRADKKSSGIGLYLTKRVCDMLRHGISVESQPKLGTRVCVDLPRDERFLTKP